MCPIGGRRRCRARLYHPSLFKEKRKKGCSVTPKSPRLKISLLAKTISGVPMRGRDRRRRMDGLGGGSFLCCVTVSSGVGVKNKNGIFSPHQFAPAVRPRGRERERLGGGFGLGDRVGVGWGWGWCYSCNKRDNVVACTPHLTPAASFYMQERVSRGGFDLVLVRGIVAHCLHCQSSRVTRSAPLSYSFLRQPGCELPGFEGGPEG